MILLYNSTQYGLLFNIQIIRYTKIQVLIIEQTEISPNKKEKGGGGLVKLHGSVFNFPYRAVLVQNLTTTTILNILGIAANTRGPFHSVPGEPSHTLSHPTNE